MMKVNKYLAFLMAAVILSIVASCQDSYDAPELEVPKAYMTPNTTILQLKKDFQAYQASTGNATYTVPAKDNSNNGIAEPCIIHGFVVSSDATGNIYQSLVIQDETAAIQFSISRASLWSLYPIGQEIVVNVTGLVVGVYGNLIQIGDYYENGGEPQVGRMLYAKFKNQSQLNGLPNDNFKYVSFDAEWPSDRPYIIATSIAEVNELAGDDDAVARMQSQLVRFQNVHWQDAGKTTYAEYEETSRRYILDSSNNSLMAYNSGYSTFYNDVLPEGTGSVEGILSYYGFDGTSDPWQLLLRSTQDVRFGDVPGTKRNPYGVADVIALDDCGLDAWAEGYIVGAFDFSGNPVFGVSDDLIDDNVLIAADASCKDVAECVCVQLPASSMLRQYANLLDNPGVIGKKLTVNGSFAPYYKMHGILVANGSKSEFSIEGVDLGAGEGNGSADDPYTVEYVLGHYKDAEADVWMSGYIVGFMDGSAGAVFGLPDDNADYNGANVLVASDPSCKDVAKCVFMKCDRNKYGLKRNPDNLGKKMKAQGGFMTQDNMAGFNASSVIVE